MLPYPSLTLVVGGLLALPFIFLLIRLFKIIPNYLRARSPPPTHLRLPDHLAGPHLDTHPHLLPLALQASLPTF